MIKLVVEDYCQTCEYFEADVTLPNTYYTVNGKVAYMTDTYIRCEHRKLCAALKNHIVHEIEEKADDPKT